MDKHIKFLAMACDIAKNCEPVGNSKISSIIVYKNDIVSIGRNTGKTHPIQKKYGRTNDHIYLHAETDALIRALREISPNLLSKCSLYVGRVFKNGRHALAKPCPGCQQAIRDFNIKEVIWTTYDGYGYARGIDLRDNNDIYTRNKEKNSIKATNIFLCEETI